MKKVGYTSVHKAMKMDTLERAVVALKRNGCSKVYIEAAYLPRVDSRPQLQDCLDSLESGDIFCITTKRVISTRLTCFELFEKRLHEMGVLIEFVKIR